MGWDAVSLLHTEEVIGSSPVSPTYVVPQDPRNPGCLRVLGVDIDSRVMEPACGSGNLLLPVLRRKLATAETRYGTSD